MCFKHCVLSQPARPPAATVRTKLCPKGRRNYHRLALNLPGQHVLHRARSLGKVVERSLRTASKSSRRHHRPVVRHGSGRAQQYAILVNTHIQGRDLAVDRELHNVRVHLVRLFRVRSTPLAVGRADKLYRRASPQETQSQQRGSRKRQQGRAWTLTCVAEQQQVGRNLGDIAGRKTNH